MALDLTTNALAKLDQVNLSTQLICKIDEIDYIFGAQVVGEYARIGQEELFIGGFDIGGVVAHPDQRDWISIDGTTTTLSQQLKPDLSTSSVTVMNVAIVNVSEQLSTWFSPGGLVDDLLGRKADIYLSLEGLAYPEDAVKIFAGVISSVFFEPGKATLEVSHPEQLKRQKMFPEFKTQLFIEDENLVSTLVVGGGGDIDFTQTTFDVADGSVFTASSGSDERYIEIDSEIMKLTAINGNQLTVVRGQLNTGADYHSDNTEVKQIYGVNKEETQIKVVDATNFVTSDDIVTTYVVINEECMEVTAASNVVTNGEVEYGLLTVNRGQINTVPFFHEQEDDVEVVYRIQGNVIDCALKALLSDGGNPFLTGIPITQFERITSTELVADAIVVPEDPEKEYGLVDGDYITITGASISGNNVTNASILGFGYIDPNYYIVLDQTLSEEDNSNAVASFKSQYNTLKKDFSLGLTPQQVDVKQHVDIKENQASAYPDVDLIVREQTDGQEYINRLLYRPFSIYSIPRKGKVSCNITAPPLGEANTKFINIDNVLNANKVKIRRNINDKFYNAVVFRYHPDIIEDDLKAGYILKSEDSENRIPIGNRPLTIDARALRRTGDALAHAKNISARFLERYKYSAEYLQITTNYKTGMPLDIGDTVILQGDSLKIVDTKNPGEEFQDRVMEIQDKSLNIKTGQVSLTLVDTTYSAQQRYGVISPGTILNSGNSTTVLRLNKSYASLTFDDEREKWLNYVNRRVTVRNDDFTYDHTTYIRGITKDLRMTVDALPSAPQSGYYLEIPHYDQDAKENDGGYKGRFVYFNPSVLVASGISETSFTVNSADAAKFTIGNVVQVHKADYSEVSGDIEVVNVSSNTITLKSSIGFTPSANDRIEKIGFEDEGLPYALV